MIPITPAVYVLKIAFLFLSIAFANEGVALEKEDLDWASHEIRQGDLRVLVAYPEGAKSFYRGARFEHSSFIYRAWIGEVKLFGPWQLKFKRGKIDSVTGMAGEFGMKSPLGFDEAKPGDSFIKIGVGHLRRPDELAYSFTKPYELVDGGQWRVVKGDTFLESTQELLALREWSYHYQKRIEAIAPTTIKISYTLKNTGTKTISTDYYAHNLLVFNDEMVAAGDRLEVLADTAGRKLYEPAMVKPRVIEFTGPISPARGYYLEMPLPPGLKNPVLARITHAKSGVSMTLQSDYSPYKLVFYGHDKTICAEPFVQITLAAGEQLSWSDNYLITLPPVTSALPP
jgi:hypothetical protein